MRRPQRGRAALPTTRARTGCCMGSCSGELTVPMLRSPWNRTCPAPSDRASPRHRARSRAARPAPKAPPAARLGGHPAGAMPQELPARGASTGPYSPLPAALPKGTERAGPVVPAQHREPASPGAHRCPRGGTDPTRRSPTHTAFVRGRPANRALDTAPGPQPAQQHLIPLSQKPVCSLTS